MDSQHCENTSCLLDDKGLQTQLQLLQNKTNIVPKVISHIWILENCSLSRLVWVHITVYPLSDFDHALPTCVRLREGKTEWVSQCTVCTKAVSIHANVCRSVPIVKKCCTRYWKPKTSMKHSRWRSVKPWKASTKSGGNRPITPKTSLSLSSLEDIEN